MRWCIADCRWPPPAARRSALAAPGTLPKGITFDKGTATFSGTAQAGTAGTYTILITSKNSSGKTAQPLTLTVAAAGPER
jgi:hypothetical protein